MSAYAIIYIKYKKPHKINWVIYNEFYSHIFIIILLQNYIFLNIL